MSQRSKGVVWYLVIALPGAFFPAIASLVVRKWITREGFVDAGFRLRLKKGWRWYLAGWLLPLGVVAVIVALAAAFGIVHADLSLKNAVKALMRSAQSGSAAQAAQVPPGMLYWLPIVLLLQSALFTPVLWGEEFGWRGFLQLRLFPGKPLVAAVATGVIWGIWHLPINIRGYNFPGFPVLGMIVFTVSTVLLSIIFGWLRERTGSIWAPSLAHAATNAVGGSLALLLFAPAVAGPVHGSAPLFISYLGILSWIPLGGLCLWIVLTGRLEPVKKEDAPPVEAG